MRYFVRFLLVLCVFLNTSAWAQPSQPFQLLTISGVGSQGDSSARFFAPILGEALGKSVIVMNYPGGNDTIAIKKYYSLPDDCNNLIIGNSSSAYVSKFLKEMVSDPMKDLTPLYGMATSTAVVLVSAESDIYTVQDLVAKYKKAGRLTGASTIPTTVMVLGFFDEATGIKTEVVKYRESAQAALNVATGLVDYTISIVGNAAYQGLIDNNKIRAIAIIGDERSTYYPKIKTMGEQGYGRYIRTFAWNGFFIHTSASAECKSHLTDVLKKVMHSAQAQKYTERPGGPKLFLQSGAEIKRLLESEYLVMPSILD